MPRRNLTILFIALIISVVCYHRADRNRYAAHLAEAMNSITTKYYKDVDRRLLYESAMEGMVGLLDKNSRYFNREETARFLEDINQEFDGIGIGIEIDEESGQLTVTSPLVGTPAFEAGLQAGDWILAVDGVSTEGWDAETAASHLRGKAGDPVRLRIQHKGAETPIEKVIVRAVIHVESILGDTRREDQSWNYFPEGHPRIGYIRMKNFGEDSVEEFDAAYQSIDGEIEGLIFDLRGNGGGLLPAAISICDRFIDEGDIVTIRVKGGRIADRYQASPKETIVDPSIPVALLIDGASASASEIVAACLQDHHRAVIVGDRSYGKGTVQNSLFLEGGQTRLKLTVATYWRPSGANIHREEEAAPEEEWGVRPDEGFRVPLTEEEMLRFYKERYERDIVISEEEAVHSIDDNEETALDPFFDPQLEKAIEYINTPSLP